MSAKNVSSTALSRGARAGSAADLLADEAKAWRELARRIGGEPLLPKGAFGLCYVLSDNPDLTPLIEPRFDDHYYYYETPVMMDELRLSGSRVLFCLFMALECEDEAAALRCQGGR